MKSQLSAFLVLIIACAALSLGACNEKPNPTNTPTTTAPTSSASLADATESPADATESPADTTTPSMGNSSPDEPPKVIRGGACTYEYTSGIATITAISDPPAGQNVCPKTPKSVAFSFTPDGATAPTLTDRHITIGDGKHPPEACLEPLGLKVGATFPIKHGKITAGTCNPVALVWPEGFLKPCSDACF